MGTKPIIHIVATQCQPEVQEKYRTWADEIHVPMLLKFNGIKGITRYERITKNAEYPLNLFIWEFDSQNAFEEYETSPELAAAREDVLATWKNGGLEPKWRVQYEPMKTWGK
ncbi:DUF4286 family protein [Chloroflexota bacterium]